MKRFLHKCLLGLTAVSLAACTPSTVQESRDPRFQAETVPDDLTGDMTLPESTAYTIPEGAETGENGGPGPLATTGDYSYYPEDKQPTEGTETGATVILYIPGADGIRAAFENIETMDADSLMEALINNNAVTDDVSVESFEIAEDESSATLVISNATSVYEAASEDEVVTAVANTFIDNFGLDTISVSVTESGGEYPDQVFSQEYDVKKQQTDSVEQDDTESSSAAETTSQTE